MESTQVRITKENKLWKRTEVSRGGHSLAPSPLNCIRVSSHSQPHSPYQYNTTMRSVAQPWEPRPDCRFTHCNALLPVWLLLSERNHIPFHPINSSHVSQELYALAWFPGTWCNREWMKCNKDLLHSRQQDEEVWLLSTTLERSKVLQTFR